MAKAAATLRDEIRANLPVRARRTFAGSLPAELRAELEEIREDWRAGRMGPVTKTGLGKSIATTLAGRGITCHSLTVVRWLDEH